MLRPLSVILALLVVVAVWRVAGAQPEPSRQDRAVDGVVDQLGQIRREFGSPNGLSNPSEFQQAARTVVQREAGSTTGPYTNSFDGRFNALPHRGQLNVAGLYVGRPADDPPHAQLQSKAFELDQLAYRLEREASYEDADAIREAAASLRTLARKLAEKSKPQPIYAPYEAAAEADAPWTAGGPRDSVPSQPSPSVDSTHETDE